jgi:cytochrome P450
VARTVLTHPDIAKDPALAPPGWTARTAGLEPTAAEQASLTTLDGERHAVLRKAFAPLFSTARMREAAPRMRAIARELLADLPSEDGAVDLVADFTTRYPLRVVGDLLGVPADRTDAAIAACALMTVDYPAHVGEAMGAFAGLAAAAHDGLADRLADRLPEGSDLRYQVFTLLFAGQLTTDPTVGVLVARLLGEPDPPADLVDDTLRRFPAAPFSLWRFTTGPVTLAGVDLPAHTPVLVDLRATDLPFGAGPHYCIGAALARLELEALVEVFRTDFPHARLAVPYETLRYTRPEGIMGGRLESLPLHMPR